MTGRKLPIVPYKALENFSKALYGATERYLQCTSFPSCHVWLYQLIYQVLYENDNKTSKSGYVKGAPFSSIKGI